MPLILALGCVCVCVGGRIQRQVDIEFQASLIYRASSRIVRAAQRDSV